VTLIDLNADVGEQESTEGVALDAAILDAVTSANVACGLHAGDARTMRVMCEAALVREVRIGAHVGYADREAFGRRDREAGHEVLRDQTLYQVGALSAIATAAGGRVSYVKPHGALYHRCATDVGQARAVIEAIVSFDSALAVLGPPGSALLSVAAGHGLQTVAEGFADRAYLSDGSLMPRSERGSVLDPAAAAEQALRIARSRSVGTAGGGVIDLDVRSLCLHSDTPGAPGLAATLRERLLRAGVELRAFT